MEPARITVGYKSVKLVCAKLKGKYVGEVRLHGSSVFKASGWSYEDLQQQLMTWVDVKPELALISAPIVEAYRGVDIRCVEFNESFWCLGELRSYPLFKGQAPSMDEAVALIKAKVDSGQQLVAKTTRERHQITLREYGVPSFESITTHPPNAMQSFRSAHCWACHHPIDNENRQECSRCGWIICLCGACGCSYEQSKQHGS